MVSTEIRHTFLKHLKKVSFVFVWKIAYHYYLSTTIRTFKQTIEAILQMSSSE